MPICGVSYNIGFNPYLVAVKTRELRVLSHDEIEFVWQPPTHWASACERSGPPDCPLAGRELPAVRTVLREDQGSWSRTAEPIG